MTLPAALRDPGLHWDNIKPAPFEVLSPGTLYAATKEPVWRALRRYVPGRAMPGPDTEVWWLVPTGKGSSFR